MKDEISSFHPNESKRPEISPLNFSGKEELQKILRDEGINPDKASPEIIEYNSELLKKRGRALNALEKMLISPAEYEDPLFTEIALQEKKEEIAKKIYTLLNMPPFFRVFPPVMEEILPIHQYFQFLIERKKANEDDERLYIQKRYGWTKEELSFEVWDAKLAALNIHWRAFVLGIIPKEEFEDHINNL